MCWFPPGPLGDWSTALVWAPWVPDLPAAQAEQWRRAAFTGSWYDDWQDLEAFDLHLDELAPGPLGGAEMSLRIDPMASGRMMWLQAREVGGLRSLPLEVDVP